MQQIEAGGLVIGDRELIRLARLAVAGLPVVVARDGTLLDTDRLLVESLLRAAQLVKRRSRTGCATMDDGSDERGASSAATWLGTSEAGAMYGVSGTYLRRLAGQRRLRAGRDSKGAWRFEPDSLAGWAASRSR